MHDPVLYRSVIISQPRFFQTKENYLKTKWQFWFGFLCVVLLVMLFMLKKIFIITDCFILLYVFSLYDFSRNLPAYGRKLGLSEQYIAHFVKKISAWKGSSRQSRGHKVFLLGAYHGGASSTMFLAISMTRNFSLRTLHNTSLPYYSRHNYNLSRKNRLIFIFSFHHSLFLKNADEFTGHPKLLRLDSNLWP